MTRDEKHPYNLEEIGHIPEGTRLLIVGTAPPPRFSLPRSERKGPVGKDIDFYYGSSDNDMWRILEELSDEKFNRQSKEDSREAMCNFLRTHRMWMRDILQTYRRKPDHETSASDNHIIQPNLHRLPTDLCKLSLYKYCCFYKSESRKVDYGAAEILDST